MSCKHQPIFHFKMLFARKPQYICRHCGANLEMAPQFKSISRVANMVFIAIMFLKALNSGKTVDPDQTVVVRLAIDMGILVGIAAAFLLFQIAIFKFAKYQESQPEEAAPPKDSTDVKEAEKPEYTAEQLELIAMYEAIEKKARLEAGQEESSVQPAAAEKPPEVDVCVHEPAPSWKNYIPSRYDFVCRHCGKPIVFTAKIKRSMNMVFLAIMFLVLMPNFMNQNIDILKYSLLSLLVLALGTAAQYFYVKKGQFVLKQTDTKGR